jgi:succinate-acetate transporter protein
MAERASENQVRTFLQPIAAPSILGLYGFAGSTFIVAANLAHWYGTPDTPLFLFPFVAIFGGVAQFSAGLWAYKARDGIATAMHGMWGSFWIGYGILNLLVATHVLSTSDPNFLPAFGYWFFALGLITFVGAIAAQAENLGLAAVLHTLWIGSGLLTIGFLAARDLNSVWVIIGGWVLLLSALCAFYAASALMLEGALGRPVLPVGVTKTAQQQPAINPGAGEPGVAKGQ